MLQTKCPFMVMTINGNVVPQEKNIKLHQNVKMSIAITLISPFMFIKSSLWLNVSSLNSYRTFCPREIALKKLSTLHFLGKCTVFYCALCTLYIVTIVTFARNKSTDTPSKSDPLIFPSFYCDILNSISIYFMRHIEFSHYKLRNLLATSCKANATKSRERKKYRIKCEYLIS